MAFSNPEVYLNELARPLCGRFKAEPASYDLAISSCIILYHFADVVAHVRGKAPHQAAAEIAEKIPEFHTIQAIANAGKHVELTRHTKSELVGLRAEHLVKGKAAAFSDGSYFLMALHFRTCRIRWWWKRRAVTNMMICTSAFLSSIP